MNSYRLYYEFILSCIAIKIKTLDPKKFDQIFIYLIFLFDVYAV